MHNGVGGIDMTHPRKQFAGTGWPVAPDLLLTNRHVAQDFVDFDTGGTPAIIATRDGHIDFGHEFRCAATRARRRIDALVFCGAKPVSTDSIDYTLLIIALFRLLLAARPLALGLGGSSERFTGRRGNDGLSSRVERRSAWHRAPPVSVVVRRSTFPLFLSWAK